MRQRKNNIARCILAGILSIAMVFTWISIPSMTNTAYAATVNQERELTGKDAGATLQSGLYYVKTDLTLNGDKSNYNGLKIADGATVYINIPAGVKLTVYGGDGTNAAAGGDAVQGSISFSLKSDKNWSKYLNTKATESSNGAKGATSVGGGAAIYVPQGANLYVIGEGTISAIGGKGGNAGQGGKGSTTTFGTSTQHKNFNNSDKKLLVYKNGSNFTASCGYSAADIEAVRSDSGSTYGYQWVSDAGAGVGGNGGAGGAGGGAGIGANGTAGAEANFGGKTGIYEDSTANSIASGATNIVTSSINCGTVQIAETIKTTLVGGVGGNAGALGNGEDLSKKNSNSFYIHIEAKKPTIKAYAWKYYNAQPGAGGGAGGSGAGVGQGGGGGSAGQGGASGAVGDSYFEDQLTGTPTRATAGKTGLNGNAIDTTMPKSAYPTYTVTYMDKDGTTVLDAKTYYVSKTDKVAIPAYTNLVGTQTFEGWEVVTPAKDMGSRSPLVTEGNLLDKNATTVSTRNISGNVVLKAKVKNHRHDWVYVLDGDNVIRAYCKESTFTDECNHSGVANAAIWTLNAPDEKYTGVQYTKANTAKVNITDQIDKSPSKISYVGRGLTSYPESTTPPTDVGKYTAKVTVNNKTATKDFEISYLEADAVVSGAKKNEKSQWYTSVVTIKPETTGYLISEDKDKWQDSLLVEGDGTHTVEYYIKDKKGYITDKMSSSFKIDTVAPTGEITVKNDKVKRFFNQITGGFFFKNTVDVTIEGIDPKADNVDEVSGNVNIQYQQTAKGETYSPDGWIDGKSFSVPANKKFDVYGRITDEAGNEIIIDSKGNVVYKDATATDEFTFTKTAKADHETNIEIGVNTIKKVSIDTGAESKAVPEEAYEVADNKIVFAADYLNTLTAGDYVINVAYNPYGETFAEGHGQDADNSKIILHVVKAKGTVHITNDISKVYDKTAVNVPEYTKDSSKLAVLEYKEKGADDSTYSETAPIKSGQYTVRVSVDADENYTKAADEKDFTISKAKAKIIVADENKEYTRTYGDETFALEGITKFGESDITFASDNEDAVKVDEDGKVTLKAAGKATITLAMAESENYEKTETTVTVEVLPKAITVRAEDKTVTYADDEAKLTYKVTGLVEGDKLTDIELSRAKGEDVGSYDIKATQKEKSNPNYDITFENGTYRIEPKDITGATVKLGSRLTYNGEPQSQAVKSVVIDGLEATYDVTDNTQTEAGTYKLKIIGNRNFTGTVEQTFVIVNPDSPSDEGNVKVYVDVDPDAPDTRMVTPKAVLMNLVMNADDAAAIADGKDLKIWLEVKDGSSSITPESIGLFEAGTKGYKIGQYLDISLFKKLSTEEKATKLTRTDKPIKIQITIPDNLVNKNKNVTRSYAIARNHEGNVEILKTAYNGKNHTLTFESDKFSDYAIIYKDKKKSDASPKTGDHFDLTKYFLLMMAALLGIIGCVVYRKKEN